MAAIRQGRVNPLWCEGCEQRNEHLRLAAPLLVQRSEVVIARPFRAVMRACVAYVQNPARGRQAEALLSLGQHLAVEVVGHEGLRFVDRQPANFVYFLVGHELAADNLAGPVVHNLG